jgi:Oxygen-sensitive ribonucleoside-triphosphate reductase
MITLCKACGTSYGTTPDRCPICEDERQYVPVTGQEWIDVAALTATHTNTCLMKVSMLKNVLSLQRAITEWDETRRNMRNFLRENAPNQEN